MNLHIKELRFTPQKAQEYFSGILAYTLGPAELQRMLEGNKVILLDVRRKEDYDMGHIKDAISIPYELLDENLTLLSKEKVTVVYCYNQQCRLGAKACLTLAEYGYPVMLLEGGFKVWAQEFNFEVVK